MYDDYVAVRVGSDSGMAGGELLKVKGMYAPKVNGKDKWVPHSESGQGSFDILFSLNQ